MQKFIGKNGGAMTGGTKICSSCLKEFEETIEFFYPDDSGKNGLSSKCKICMRENSRKWKENNKEKNFKITSDWRKSNKEKIRLQSKKWRENNLDKYRETKRLNNMIRKSKYKGAWTNVSNTVIREMFEEQEGKCYYCNCDITSRYHIEHKTPLSKGGHTIKSNLCLSCPECNMGKHTKTEEEYLEWIGEQNDNSYDR